jgi:hypothetical protein
MGLSVGLHSCLGSCSSSGWYSDSSSRDCCYPGQQAKRGGDSKESALSERTLAEQQ